MVACKVWMHFLSEREMLPQVNGCCNLQGHGNSSLTSPGEIKNTPFPGLAKGSDSLHRSSTPIQEWHLMHTVKKKSYSSEPVDIGFCWMFCHLTSLSLNYRHPADQQSCSNPFCYHGNLSTLRCCFFYCLDQHR